jgi:glucose/arabinose dehydrogenase
MKHRLLVLGLAVATLTAAACDDDGNATCPTTTPCPTCAPCPGSATATRTATGTPSGTRTATATSLPTASPTPMAMAEVFVSNANAPVSLAFAPDGGLFYNELRTGRVRIVKNGQLQDEPFASVDVVNLSGYSEHGLLGLALDPDFASNHYVYLFYSEPNKDGDPLRQRLVRFTEVDGVGQDMTVILDDLPIGPECCHNGGRIAFGPDGKLYVSIGDTQQSDLSQNPDSLAGKILRVNPDGSVPQDNPFPGSLVYALGIRNSFGLAFHPVTGALFIDETGPSGFDELDIIQPGGNYGWPATIGIAGLSQYIDPIWAAGPVSVTPTGMTFYTGDALPIPRNDLLRCTYNAGKLEHVKMAPSFDHIDGIEDAGLSCSLDVKVGPDGAVYFSTMATIYRWGS